MIYDFFYNSIIHSLLGNNTILHMKKDQNQSFAPAFTVALYNVCPPDEVVFKSCFKDL